MPAAVGQSRCAVPALPAPLSRQRGTSYTLWEECDRDRGFLFSSLWKCHTLLSFFSFPRGDRNYDALGGVASLFTAYVMEVSEVHVAYFNGEGKKIALPNVTNK